MNCLISVFPFLSLISQCFILRQMYFVGYIVHLYLVLQDSTAVVVAQWVRAFTPQAEGWVFKSQPRS